MFSPRDIELTRKQTASILQVELKEKGRWGCQFSITVVGKEGISVCTGYAKETFERPADTAAAGLQAAKAWIEGNS